MLAYVFWHWKRDDVSAGNYEERLRAFHSALRAAPPPGFANSWSAGLAGADWVHGRGESYEDWYLMGGSGDLDPLEQAAISASRQVPHDRAAAAAGGGTAGLYRLRAGPVVPAPSHSAWFAKPAGWSYATLLERIRPLTIDAALWGRQMTLGPAAEFCLHSRRPVTLPDGIDAQSIALRTVFPDGA